MDSKTPVFDAATIFKALTAHAQHLNNEAWRPASHVSADIINRQTRLLYLHGLYAEIIEELDNLEVKSSNQADVLNDFLASHNFERLFKEISPDGLGTAVVLDMMASWLTAGTRTQIVFDGKTYPAFSMDGGLAAYRVPGSDQPLIRLMSSDGNSVWLLKHGRPQDGLELFDTAMMAMLHRGMAPAPAQVLIPMLDIDTRADLDWILGMELGAQTIEQAFQMFKVRMNEHGARAKVATGIATRESMVIPYTFDEPFILWFTQGDSEIPIATCYAATDSWSDPGSLDM